MRKLKVLHVADSYEGGGAEAVFRDTIQATKESGYSVAVHTSLKKTNPLFYIFNYNEYIRMNRVLEQERPDIIHLQNYYHYLSPAILLSLKKFKRKHSCKVIFTAHDYHLICPNSGLQSFNGGERKSFSPVAPNIGAFNKFDHRSWLHSSLKLLQHTLGYRLCKWHNVFDAIISPSDFLKNVFMAYGIKQPISVFRNPLLFQAPVQAEEGSAFASSEERLKLVFIGRVEPEKGVCEFIDNLAGATTIPCEIHIYGKGSEVENIKRSALNASLPVHFHGHMERERLMKELAGFDAFFLPSLWYENAPLSIIEAAKIGLPVIVPDYGGLAEMAKRTARHYLYSSEEPDTLRNALISIKNDRKKNRLSDASEFDFDVYKENLRALYESNIEE